jgi:serine/threonine protein kinase
MKVHTQACDPRRVAGFLDGQLSNAELASLEEHLSACTACRTSLGVQTADEELWDKASRYLRDDDRDEESFPAMNDSGAECHQAHSIQQVLGSLGPTDDPEMLGRLGGYEVSGVVGSGGMGVVLKALDKSLDRIVAIKMMAPYLSSNGASRKRFAREAKAAAAVLHPNVIAIHSVSSDGSLPYLVMPYMRGPSLQKRLDTDGPLPVNDILRIAAQTAAGLAAAHAQGLVHRDIKPANILLEEGVERVAITDFGLARAVDDASMTRTGVVAGTPQYMSPEQSRGESIDQRSDLFSLGSVMYAMCTGRAPFRAESSYGVLRRITDAEPTPIRELNPEIPDWLCLIITRLMEKQSHNRFASAEEVGELLEECLAHVQQPTVAPLPKLLRTQHKSRRFRSFSIRSSGVITMLATVCVILLGMFLWQSSAPPDIAGAWTSEDWGPLILEQKQSGEYGAFYSAPVSQRTGTIRMKWSRLHMRFNGTWVGGDGQTGKISVRLVDDEIRGAWTTTRESATSEETPRLVDLLWVHPVLTLDLAGGHADKTKVATIDPSTLPRVSNDFQHQTKVINGLVCGGGIIERIEGETIHFRSGDRIVAPGGTLLLLAKHGVPLNPNHTSDQLEQGMVIAYSLRNGKIEKLVLTGIVDQKTSDESVFDKIKTLDLRKGNEVTDSLDGRLPLSLTGTDGEVMIGIGETRLFKLAKPTESIEWRVGKFKPEGIDDIEPFDYGAARQ